MTVKYTRIHQKMEINISTRNTSQWVLISVKYGDRRWLGKLKKEFGVSGQCSAR